MRVSSANSAAYYKFDTLAAAETQYSARKGGKGCWALSDAGCDASGPYYLCSAGANIHLYLNSGKKTDSCMYTAAAYSGKTKDFSKTGKPKPQPPPPPTPPTPPEVSNAGDSLKGSDRDDGNTGVQIVVIFCAVAGIIGAIMVQGKSIAEASKPGVSGDGFEMNDDEEGMRPSGDVRDR